MGRGHRRREGAAAGVLSASLRTDAPAPGDEALEEDLEGDGSDELAPLDDRTEAAAEAPAAAEPGDAPPPEPVRPLAPPSSSPPAGPGPGPRRRRVVEHITGRGHTLEGHSREAWVPGEVGDFPAHVVDSAPHAFAES